MQSLTLYTQAGTHGNCKSTPSHSVKPLFFNVANDAMRKSGTTDQFRISVAGGTQTDVCAKRSVKYRSADYANCSVKQWVEVFKMTVRRQNTGRLSLRKKEAAEAFRVFDLLATSVFSEAR
jgi:hypothetical protein